MKIYKTLTGFLALLLIAALVIFSFLRGGSVAVKSPVYMLMGTTVQITAVAKDERTAHKAIEKARQTIAQTEAVMSYYKSDSQLSMINSMAHKKAVKIDAELFEVISKSIEFNKLTGGAFDCTIAPVLELWRQSAKNGTKPTQEQLAQAKAKTGSDKLIINAAEHTVKFAIEGMKLDLGGIAKGYAVDKAVDAMRSAGANGGLIDAGGDIRCFGTPPSSHKNWTVGLQNPDITAENGRAMIRKFVINDMAITTSGDYYRFVVVGGEKISHIIDPSISKPAKQLCSVSVIAPDATAADALSTAVTVLGTEKGMALIESLDGIEAMLIECHPQEKTFQSSGIEKYIEK